MLGKGQIGDVFDSLAKAAMSAGTRWRILLASALAASVLPCAAQLQLEALPEPSLLAPQAQQPLAAAPPPEQPKAFYSTSASASGWLGSAISLEAPRATNTGQYTRPRFNVGVPSESMRGFLSSAGFAAEKCQLPMVRARTSTNGDGDVNGALWLYARCTFR